MQLPGQLRQTTLGDLLGTLCRGRVAGVLELCEPTERVHRIHLRDGWVLGVESPDDEMAEARRNSESPRRAHQECLARLETLFAMPDARIRFRVARPLGRGSARFPLAPTEFLRGRPRGRGRENGSARDRRVTELHDPYDVRSEARARALSTLGLGVQAGVSEITVAFRKLARELHPDLHHGASAIEQARVEQRFAEISAAYHALVP
jgi:hypothetical protein